ncbi:RNA-binding cell elongation regulator Jag/EloR [Gemella sanguinis]|jgi:protein jag|uniref:RNA-binding cell elongation regulator Jag/EloR n=1 Tax=Gemella sanguinis TaxID=84135 RepID=UPI0028E46EDB|nr:RNA-binding cell elongation regulator Jag/EloR [Gemella sanguinis]
MEKEFIYVAGTVDEAIKNGLADLGLREEDVKIEVLEGGSTGIFGLFKKEARVKLSPLDSEFKKEDKPKVEKKEVKEVKPEVKEEVKEQKQEEKVVVKEEKETPVAEKTTEVKEETVVEKEEIKEQRPKREDYIVKNQDKIVSYLQNIVIAMGYPDATVEFSEDGNRHFTLNIKTEENTSLIIGKRGSTLNSLQFLVNNYAKKFSSHFFRIEVDCDDYRESRKKTLEELALNLAKKSKKTGRPVELEPMTSVERKIIHNALTGIKNVETESRGDEPYRYLVITAK